MSLHTDVPLDGCVVHVVTQQEPEGHFLSTCFLEGAWMDMTSSGPEWWFTLESHHEMACQPQSCARAVLRFLKNKEKRNEEAV